MKSQLILATIMVLCVAGVFSGQAKAEDSLVYVSFITGVTSGGTNIYEITPGGQKIIGTLGNGGGGPVAVDAQENVYIVQADIGSNGYQIDSAIYQYARGSKTGKLLFTANNLGAEAMTITSDGTVYMAGQIPQSNYFSVVKFAPPSYTPDVLRTAQNPRYPTGIAVDTSGNVFVSWSVSVDGGYPACSSGCIEELPAGQNKWIVRLPNLAANEIAAGPVATTDGSLIFWTGNNPFFNYIETVAKGSNYPSGVAQFTPTVCSSYCPNAAMAFNAAGNELWTTNWGFTAAIGTEVVAVDYPSGKVALKFSVNKPSDLVFISGIAVSPAYIP
ncbi:MAG TPA: hypothetical protein VF753_14235 [Terriglobales bacterium]